MRIRPRVWLRQVLRGQLVAFSGRRNNRKFIRRMLRTQYTMRQRTGNGPFSKGKISSFRHCSNGPSILATCPGLFVRRFYRRTGSNAALARTGVQKTSARVRSAWNPPRDQRTPRTANPLEGRAIMSGRRAVKILAWGALQRAGIDQRCRKEQTRRGRVSRTRQRRGGTGRSDEELVAGCDHSSIVETKQLLAKKQKVPPVQARRPIRSQPGAV